MTLNELRFGASLLISAILTVIVTVGGYLISNLVNPNYHYSIFEGLLIALFVAFCFAIIFGFSYYFIGFWQETKDIGNPNRREPNDKSENNPRSVITESSIQASWKPESMFKANSLEDFGLRQFSENDDWINMKKGSGKK
jgi:hypothetical protein